MRVLQSLLLRAFGRPKGILGRLGGHVMARMNAGCARSTIELLDLRPNDRVLEIGFGPGIGIALAAEKGAFVGGADASRTMVAQAQVRNASAIGQGRVDLRCALAERLPFDDSAFDKAFAINSMQLWPDQQKALCEIRRVLKKGGRAAFAFTPNSGQGKDGVLDALTASGFRQARLVDAEGCFCALVENP